MWVDCQPISPQKIAGLLGASAAQEGRVSSPSSQTGSGVAGPERIVTRSTLPNLYVTRNRFAGT
jgi:hypothetical protein